MGRAVAIQLAKKGANVVVVARTTEKLQLAVESMKVSVATCALDALGSFTLSLGGCIQSGQTEVLLH